VGTRQPWPQRCSLDSRSQATELVQLIVTTAAIHQFTVLARPVVVALDTGETTPVTGAMYLTTPLWAGFYIAGGPLLGSWGDGGEGREHGVPV
jgi:hypothetical protein